MLQNNNTNCLNTIVFNELKSAFNSKLTPSSSKNQTASSSIEMQSQKKPTSVFTYTENTNLIKSEKSPFLIKNPFNAFQPIFNFKIGYQNNIQNNFNYNFIEKKQYINKIKDPFKNDETLNFDEKENGNILNFSAFKKFELSDYDDLYNSAFKKNISFKKIKIINKKKIKKKLINKIIINDSNNNLKNSENNKASENNTNQKIKIFKSIKYNNKKAILENDNEIIFLKKRRGRKTNSEKKGKRVHNASDFDNILRKIQVHYLTFIVCFTNDLIEVFLPNRKDLRFKNLDYNLKKTVNHSYVQKLKNKTIGEILQFKASSKNRKFESFVNQTIYQKICELSQIMKGFFEFSYLTVFNEYYYKSQRTISFGGKNINISQRTKLFTDLVHKNIESAEKIQQIALDNFIELKNNKKIPPIFVINKKNN